MASITIDQGIKGILGLGNRVANRAVEIMKEKAATKEDGSPTGHKYDKPLGEPSLVDSIRILEHRAFSREYVIGSTLPYAIYVDQGRGPVHVKNKQWLHWWEPDRGDVFKKSVAAAKGNHFVRRTKEALEQEKFSIVE